MGSFRFVMLLLAPAVFVLLGTLGYRLIEGWPLFDCLYMTVITLTTVGFLEVHPLSWQGRLFTMCLCLLGIFSIFYAASEIIRTIISEEFHELLGRQRMERRITAMKDHIIVCGYGRMGRLVCQELTSKGTPFVVIEKEANLVEGFHSAIGAIVHGDATSDEALRHAGVERARALITVVASVPDNLYITMSARLLNERLFIVARAEDDRSEEKLQRAGANRAVAPYRIGGTRVAQAVLRPHVVDFIELATRTGHLELQIEETNIKEASPLANQTLLESKLRQEHGLIIVAIKKKNGAMTFNPPPEIPIQPGDVLIALGDRVNLDALERLANGG